MKKIFALATGSILALYAYGKLTQENDAPKTPQNEGVTARDHVEAPPVEPAPHRI